MKTKTKTQIKITLIIVFLAAVALSGCSKNGNITGPNGTNDQVSFRISQQAGYYGGTQFLFQPSVNVNISRIISSFPAQQFADTVGYANVNYVYSKDSVYIINEFTNIQNGQQWNFNFTGSLPGQQNSNYNVTANYTAQ
jgi:hypothetical protein